MDDREWCIIISWLAVASGAFQEALDRLVEVVHSLEQDYDPIWGSMVKQVIRRVHPGFNEGYYGYTTSSDLLEDAASSGLIDLVFDETRRNYQIRPKKD